MANIKRKKKRKGKKNSCTKTSIRHSGINLITFTSELRVVMQRANVLPNYATIYIYIYSIYILYMQTYTFIDLHVHIDEVSCRSRRTDYYRFYAVETAAGFRKCCTGNEILAWTILETRRPFPICIVRKIKKYEDLRNRLPKIRSFGWFRYFYS